jgi:transposase-like protein
MKTSKFTPEQSAFALKQVELGTQVGEVCRKMGISEATFYSWRKKYGGLGSLTSSPDEATTFNDTITNKEQYGTLCQGGAKSGDQGWARPGCQTQQDVLSKKL